MSLERKITVNSITNSILIVLLGVIATCSFIWSMPEKEDDTKYDTAEEYMKELQISYQGTKSMLVDETQHYIDSVAPNSGLRALVLVEKCEKFGVPVTFALAQGEIESHFGTKGLAYRTNSVWNVGAYDGHDFTAIKHKYSNPNESVEPYLQLLITNYLQGKTVEDLFESFTDINGNRYASDKYYEIKLKEKYENIQSKYNIDSLQARLNYYKIRLNS